MARGGARAGAGRKPKGTPAAGGPGHNSGAKTIGQMDDDQRHALTVQHRGKYEAALATKKAGDAAFKNICKLARADLGSTAIDDIKELIEFESEGSEVRFQAEIERRMRNARWAGVEVGFQAELFGGTERPIRERAFDEGKRAGLAGEPLDTKHYTPGTDGYIGVTEGWHAGQVLKAGQFKKPTGAEAGLIQTPSGDQPDAFDGDTGGGSGEQSQWPDDEQAKAKKAAAAAGAPAAEQVN